MNFKTCQDLHVYPSLCRITMGVPKVCSWSKQYLWFTQLRINYFSFS